MARATKLWEEPFGVLPTVVCRARLKGLGNGERPRVLFKYPCSPPGKACRCTGTHSGPINGEPVIYQSITA